MVRFQNHPIMKFLVNWNYRAGWKEDVLILHAGETVHLDDDAAAHVLADSPGVLTPLAETATAEPVATVTETETVAERALDQAPQDRQIKRAPKREKKA